MRTVIEGGWVVAWNGKSHEVHEQGSVVFEGDRVVHAGPAWTGTADARISARGKLVSPGFINTHVHTAGGGGDYLLLDMAKNDYRTANYMAFAAPLKGKMAPPPAEPTAAIRAFTFLHALKNGTTTVIDVGGLRGDWEGYARLVDELGVRVYGGPPFRDRDTYTDAQGRLYYDEDAAAGRSRLQEAVDFGRKFDGAAGGRLRVLFNAAQVETCSEPLLRAGKDAARAQNAPIHTHAGGNLVEFQRIMDEYRKTPIRLPGRHRLPRRPHAPRARGLHDRARLDALSVRRRPGRAGRARRDRRPLPVQVREDGDDAPLVPALPGRGRDAGPRHRHLSARHGRPSCGGRPSWPRSPTPTTRPASRGTSSTRPPSGAAASSGGRIWAAWPRAPRPTSC